MPNQITLRGCAPEPLIHYLKALGVLRLVAEQLDPDVRGAWRGDAFVLETSKTADELVTFFLEKYVPTPLVAPWNNGSGFHSGEGKGKKAETLPLIENSTIPRLEKYREVIKSAKELLATCMTPDIIALSSTKRSEALKPKLISLCRNRLPDEVVRWVDALCLIVEADDLRFPRLLGSGGNDGNLEFSLNFMRCLDGVLPIDGSPRPHSKGQLRAALFGETGARGVHFSPGQFHPAGSGGVNATSGEKAVKAENLANPWDYVLAIEGTLSLAGAAVRRMTAGARGEASFPFWVSNSEIDTTVAEHEENRGDLFLPLWTRFASYAEIAHIFSEGRVRLKTRQARNTVDFARAIAELGVDRGITHFYRYSLLTRNGKMQFASSLGCIEVEPRPKADLFYDLEERGWLTNFRAICGAKEAPLSLAALRRGVEAAIYEYCANKNHDTLENRETLLSLLVALGKAESEIARRPSSKKPKPGSNKPSIKPLELSSRWARECDDGTPEFELAAALASITGEGEGGAIRANLEPVETVGASVLWTTDDAGAVWGTSRLEDNLATVLQRRSIDARAGGLSHPSISGRRVASLSAVDSFLRGEIDDERIEELLRGLALIDWRDAQPTAAQTGVPLPPELPRAYALLKLLFLPGGKLRRERQAEPVEIKHEPSVVPLLRAGRIADALDTALRRLRSSGLMPFTHQFHFPEEDGARLAAALLIPISEHSTGLLAGAVLRPPRNDV
jgi:CRISPR-associated protein Csx17